MTDEDYKTSRTVCVVIGFICLIIPGVIAMLVLPKKK
jgi:chromate transport protein ChrA